MHVNPHGGATDLWSITETSSLVTTLVPMQYMMSNVIYTKLQIISYVDYMGGGGGGILYGHCGHQSGEFVFSYWLYTTVCLVSI